jgi:hypothetical protein
VQSPSHAKGREEGREGGRKGRKEGRKEVSSKGSILERRKRILDAR